ncbi:hypothetical protein L3Y34_011607 [Caenorhabditis briggsae]|uniref:Uncharacterized protein n=1 Tax=Caenorhabditis briggsae TaxID=6238 RepID=A0AAE9CUN1_CAEBR|nr:hypothetical protein L3Y34_011607 [Caenorhabditis briggsae]
MPPDVNWKFQFQIEPTVERVHDLVPQLMPLEGEEEDDVDRRPRVAQQLQDVNQNQNAANNRNAIGNENRIANQIRNRAFDRAAGERENQEQPRISFLFRFFIGPQIISALNCFRYFRARREMYEARRQNHGLPPVRNQPSTSGIAPAARRN